jgi:2,4-dienoyl-CoA reductase-like NADH-dependent reductase (Old Yellow Enzyme family)/thioredoxin reductase
VSYEHLLSPAAIGPLPVRNRIVMPAMDQNTCDDGQVTDKTVAHYEARARGGTGLLILETSAVAWPVGATSLHQPALSDDRFVPGLRRLGEAVHAHGAKMVVQMCHHGKTAGVDAMQERPQLVPSLPLPHDEFSVETLTMPELMKMAGLTGGKQATQREATTDDLAWVVEQFAEAAARVQQAGLDGVEIHAAHGYLISTFLSPRFNTRTDAYGSTTENRARLLVEIVRAIRRRCGDEFAVIVRLDGKEYASGGITPELAASYAVMAQAAGAHAIHVSGNAPNATGVGFTDGPLPWQRDQYIEHAAIVRRSVDVPVIAVGRILPDAAEDHLANGRCDFVSMGRQLLADPELPNRLAAGRPDLVRTCINCFVCVAQNFWDGVPICAVNAELGHTEEGPLTPAATRRHVIVVGGGPGGMEAARVAATRGHRVTLLEKAAVLGGTARFSSLTTPMNAELVRYLTASLEELRVDVRTGTEATPELVRTLGADAVVVASGARRVRPDVPGADLPHVLSGDDLRALLTGDDPTVTKRLSPVKRIAVTAGRRLGITNDMDKVRDWSRRWLPLGDNVVVVGGGLVGIELAEFLAERDREVLVVEAGDKLGVEMAHPRRARAVHEAKKHGVRFLTGAELVAVRAGEVDLSVKGATTTVPADHVILASGVQPDSSVADRFRAEGFEVHVVGDAAEVGYIEGAVRSGYLTGRAL